MSISRIHLGLIALLACGVSACQTTQPGVESTSSVQLQHIEKGMTPDEVRGVLGPPRQTIQSDDTVRWMEYGSTSHRFRIYFDGEQVKAVPRHPPGT